MPHDSTSTISSGPTAHLTADAVDAVLRSASSDGRKLAELRGMVALSRRALAPVPEPVRLDARKWPDLRAASPTGALQHPVDRYDPRD